jgi:hypothetical protein
MLGSDEKCFEAFMVLGRFCGRAIVYNMKFWRENWHMYYLPGNLQLHVSVNQCCVREVPRPQWFSSSVLIAFVYYMENSHSVVTWSNCITEALSALFNVI